MAFAPHTHVQRASRGVLAVARGDTAAHEHLRDRVLTIVWVTIVLDVVATLVVFAFEHHARAAEIHNLWDAFLFTTGQLLTASSVAAPVTTVGKVLEIVFDLYAITVVAALAGSFGAFFHKRGQEMAAEKAAAEASSG